MDPPNPGRELRSKRNQERLQRQRAEQELRAQQAASSHHSSSHHSSSHHSSSRHSSSSHYSPSHHSSTPSTHSSPEYMDEDVISVESDPLSAAHTDRADEYPAPHFPIISHGMFERFERLQKRHFCNTRRVDFDALHAFGVYDEFVHLTQRVGFTADFWTISCDSYVELTLEFLSSLKLKWSDDRPYIKFQMRGETQRVMVDTLRGWFGFAPNPQTDSLSFRVGMDKDHFWRLITGREVAHSNQFRSLVIPHPVLRCMQRALANTIFARGETVSRVNEEDLQMMDHMLRTEAEMERPDLMLIMVRHWIGVQQNKRVGGGIHIGAYVTLIAEQLDVSFAGLTFCQGPTIMDAKAYQQANFIKIQKASGLSDRYLWRMPDGGSLPMPIVHILRFGDERTWLFVPHPPSPLPSHHSPSPAARTTEPHATPPPVFPSTSAPPPPSYAAGPSSSPTHHSYPPPVSAPTIQDVYSLVYDMRSEQGEILRDQGTILRDLQVRMSDLEDAMREWGFGSSAD